MSAEWRHPFAVIGPVLWEEAGYYQTGHPVILWFTMLWAGLLFKCSDGLLFPSLLSREPAVMITFALNLQQTTNSQKIRTHFLLLLHLGVFLGPLWKTFTASYMSSHDFTNYIFCCPKRIIWTMKRDIFIVAFKIYLWLFLCAWVFFPACISVWGC